MTTLEHITILTGLTTLLVAWIMVAVSSWRYRRQGGDTWRGYRRGFLLTAAGLTLSEARLLFRLPHEFTLGYVLVGGVAVGIAALGFIVVVRAYRSERDRRPGAAP
jgi:hypothetical protein